MVKLKILLLDIVKPLESAVGCSVHRFELVNNLARLNHKVHIISMRNSVFSEFKNIECHYISNKNELFLYMNYMVIFIYLALFRQFDVVYTRNPNLGFLADLVFKKLKGNRVIFEVNGIAADEHELMRAQLMKNETVKHMRMFAEKISEKAINFMRTYALNNASLIISVTEGIKEYLTKFYGIDQKKIYVIGNGANTDLFRPIQKTKCIKELNLDVSYQYVCFIGYMAPWQGIEYLIAAAPAILSENPDTKFLIVGDGPMREELMTLTEKTGVSDKIIFTGAVSYNEVPTYINSSDVCVAPFIKARNMKIGLSPLKIYEYAACGKPVVSSRIPNLEFLEQNNAGLLMEPENTEELTKAVIKLLKDEKIRREMGKNGRKYVVENCSWASVARKVAEVCKDVTK